MKTSILVTILSVLTCSGAMADEIQTRQTINAVNPEPPRLFYSGPVPRSSAIASDATLNDVCGIGQNCWAVGERGVVLRSEDDGVTWQTSLAPVDCSLHSVCFLTNSLGFAGGSVFDPVKRQYRGILLSTRDGGQSWNHIVATLQLGNSAAASIRPDKALPPVSMVRFFDLEHGLAISRPLFGTARGSVLRTEDGGRTWQFLSSDSSNGRWHTGDFLTPNDGVVVGEGNAAAAVVGQQVITLAPPQPDLRMLNDASISRDGHGWLVGDGGMLLTSTDRGVSWNTPSGKLAAVLNDLLDYRTVDHQDTTVCIAGAPGSVILHSADGGQSWTFRQLSNGAPVRKLRFTGANTVLAVGALGIIHRSEDKGLTWNAVRNKGHRAAVLSLTTNAEDTSFRLISNIGGEQGYRTVVLQPSGRLPGMGAYDRQIADRMSGMVAFAGGNCFELDWMFARTQALQHLVEPELRKAWSRQTDGRVSELLPQRLARAIRIWRPDIVTVDCGSADDVVARTMLQTLTAAQRLADGTDGNGDILTRTGLNPWRVSAVFLRQHGAASSPLSFRGDDLLMRCGTSSDLIADYCRSGVDSENSVVVEEYNAARSAAHYYRKIDADAAAATPSHMFSGITAAPGSDSRRQLAQPRHELDVMRQIAKKQANQRAAYAGQFQLPSGSMSMIANLKGLGKGLPDRLALQQLVFLAELYESRDDLEGQIAVLNEITERFPDAAESADAAEQLFQFYSSAELRFLRKKLAAEDTLGDSSSIRQVSGSIPGVPSTAYPPQQQLGNPPPTGAIGPGVESNVGKGTLFPNSSGSVKSAIDQQWDRKAEAALKLLERLNPDRARSPSILLRTAANARRAGTMGAHQTILSEAAADENFHALLARAELQAMHAAATVPVPVTNVQKTSSRPLLDGNLDEACWQNATELHLSAEKTLSGPKSDCLLMMSWDSEFIYLGGRAEFTGDEHKTLDPTAPRSHDAKHGLRDRIQFLFDVDRDYATGFQFTVDEAGQTSDYCWRSRSWNPEWFVAENADESSWRFEVAIPHNALKLKPIRAGELWAIRIQRTVPGTLTQTLSNKYESEEPTDTRGFGLLRFIRTQK